MNNEGISPLQNSLFEIRCSIFNEAAFSGLLHLSRRQPFGALGGFKGNLVAFAQLLQHGADVHENAILADVITNEAEAL